MIAGLPAKQRHCCVSMRASLCRKSIIRVTAASGPDAACARACACRPGGLKRAPASAVNKSNRSSHCAKAALVLANRLLQTPRPCAASKSATDSIEVLSGALMPHASYSRLLRALRTVRAGGFSLIEILVTLTIVGILTGISAPSVFGLLANQRIKMATYDFYSALAYARSQAIQRYEAKASSSRSHTSRSP